MVGGSRFNRWVCRLVESDVCARVVGCRASVARTSRQGLAQRDNPRTVLHARDALTFSVSGMTTSGLFHHEGVATDAKVQHVFIHSANHVGGAVNLTHEIDRFSTTSHAYAESIGAAF